MSNPSQTMPAEYRFVQTDRPPSARELRWVRLKFDRTRGILWKGARRSIAYLSVAIPALTIILIHHGSNFWTGVLSLVCFFALLSLNDKRASRREIDQLNKLVESGRVRETRIVSDRCFEFQVKDEDDDEPQTLHFFDLGEHGVVTTDLRDETPDPGFRKFRRFPAIISTDEKDRSISDLRYSIRHRFPNSDFKVNRFEIDDKVLGSWVRCRGRILKPVRNIYFSSTSEEAERREYEPMTVIAIPFDDCMNQILERG